VIQLDVDERTRIETKRFRREIRALLGYLVLQRYLAIACPN
jgi:hypothetical protein